MDGGHQHSSTVTDGVDTLLAVASWEPIVEEAWGRGYTEAEAEGERVAALWRRQGWAAWVARPKKRVRGGAFAWCCEVRVGKPVFALVAA